MASGRDFRKVWETACMYQRAWCGDYCVTGLALCKLYGHVGRAEDDDDAARLSALRWAFC